MKRLVLGFFIFAFVFNTISLSAYAAVCPHVMKEEKKAESVAPCHESASSQKGNSSGPSVPSKAGHCKGLCFCQHASLGQNIVPLRFAEPLEGLSLVKSLALPAGAQDFRSVAYFPLERPPKHFS
ncbi:MAG: hypothetical protein KA099_08800 [Alphaproteobacteria bacterium]|nr:hypothetical protein [Alphaproteobacteria bacterium]MBP7758173.1 hypothetical protein [Alphaproteobacteria bacterium]MBP7761394.1 hypothetical protein [Alphaproteobacteria bacterium]MBP7905408.1 hypothetical protein [Alphaproteobacteria bacterium]